jgi:hypothetical protein
MKGLHMLAADEIRTFPCPQCNEIISTGSASCSYCGAPIDASTAAALADRQGIRSQAFASAHGLVITARAFPIFYALSFLPFIGVVGELGVLVLLIRVPWEGVRWYRRYGKLEDPHSDVRQARRWFQQALWIWAVAVVVTILWTVFRLTAGVPRG